MNAAPPLAAPLHGAASPLWSELRDLAGPAVTDGPAAGVDAMRRAGLLAMDPGDGRGLDADGAVALATTLRRLGRADLVMARLFEGHVNALKLIALHGTDAQRRAAVAQARDGALFGVWGADGDPPAAIEGDRLGGCKRFCSGLGVVARAVVPVGRQLVLIEAGDTARQDPSAWTASAMRASASGRFDLEGLGFEPLGQPGVYATEPFFEGGIWRYAAAHVGGAEALIDALQAALAAQGRAADAVQSARIARAVMQAHAARRMIEDAAIAVEAAGRARAPRPDDAIPRAVALALLAREFVETACIDVIALTERGMGMAAHVEGTAVDRIRRDLSLFLRQANPDGKLSAAAGLIRDGGWQAGETW